MASSSSEEERKASYYSSLTHYHHYHHHNPMEEDIWKSLASLHHVQKNNNPIGPTILKSDAKIFHDFFSKPNNGDPQYPTTIFNDSLKTSPYSPPTQNHPTTALSLNSGPDQYFQPIKSLKTTSFLSPVSTSPFKQLGYSPEKSGFYASSGESCTKTESVNNRLIKNRESAARSRVRKQALAMELEIELNKVEEDKANLMEELQKLKKQLESFQAQEHELEKRGLLERSVSL